MSHIVILVAYVNNLKNELIGYVATNKTTWNAFCLVDLGNKGASFVALPQIPPRNVTWFKKGKWIHWVLIAFEKYFICKKKADTSEPIFEKMGVEAGRYCTPAPEVTPIRNRCSLP